MKELSEKPILIVSILLKKRGAVGGMAQRFSLAGAKLIERGANVELLTTRSLAEEFKFDVRKKVHLIEDAKARVPFNSWVLLFFLLVKVAFGRYRQVHIAGAGRLLKPLVFTARVSGTRLSCTFASRTLDMASYGRAVDRQRWVELLDAVDAVDVLNPGHDLDRWEDKISVSPCSFPSKKDSLGEISRGVKENIAVFCGALENNKNPLLALDIIFEYWQAYGSVTKLVVFGKGVLETEVRDRMERINKQVGVEVARFGSFDSFSETLQAANVFFSLQELDNYPSQAAMEGMLMGCKVIATDEGDTRLLLPESEPLNAVVRSRDAKDFISYLRLANEDLRPSIENANHIQRNHNLERFSNYLASFLGERSE